MNQVKIIAAVLLVCIVLGIVATSMSAVMRVIVHNWYWVLGAGILYFLLKDKR
jgi:ABC-type enterochelin transport system permease subunit